MEIFWYGHSCFRLVERGKASVVTDPFDSTIAGYTPLKLKSEIVTVSCDDLFIIMLKPSKVTFPHQWPW